MRLNSLSGGRRRPLRFKCQSALLCIPNDLVRSLSGIDDVPLLGSPGNRRAKIEAQGYPAMARRGVQYLNLFRDCTLPHRHEQFGAEPQAVNQLFADNAMRKPLVSDLISGRRADGKHPSIQEYLAGNQQAGSPTDIRNATAGVGWKRDSGHRRDGFCHLLIAPLIHCDRMVEQVRVDVLYRYAGQVWKSWDCWQLCPLCPEGSLLCSQDCRAPA